MAFPADSGWAWGLAIVMLVILIRIILIPLFVKQIKSQRNLQIIQPQVKEIQKKYAGDRERQSQELMKLYKETGTNPLSSCLPILAQAPIFYALFVVLQGIAMSQPKGVLTDELVESARNATILGAPIYGTFMSRAETANPTATLWVTLLLIFLMTLTSFLTQRQLIVKNTAPDNPMVQQQKILLYVFPIIFAVTGINFPIGVLLYWFTTNLWTMGQQFYVIRNSPQPGTPAFDALEARKAARKSKKNPESTTEIEPTPEVKPARQQPKKKPKKKRK
jgi:YidC/Oxa1 family membrane protein insertase